MWPGLKQSYFNVHFYGSFHKLFELPVSLANQMWMFCKHLLPPIGHHHLQLHFLECNKWRVNSYLSYAPIVDKLEHMQLQLSSVMQVGQHQNLQECLRRKAKHNQPKLKDFKLRPHLTSILHSEPCGETFFAGNLVFGVFLVNIKMSIMKQQPWVWAGNICLRLPGGGRPVPWKQTPKSPTCLCRFWCKAAKHCQIQFRGIEECLCLRINNNYSNF